MSSSLYSYGKKIFKFLFPPTVQAKLTPLLRNLHYKLYQGNKYACNICEATLSRFVLAENGNVICPKCGSTERARTIWEVYSSLKAINSVLHFSPNEALRKKFENTDNLNYLSSDFSDEFSAAVRYDITSIPEKDETFNLIICMHVLEHIEDDQEAMNEMFRVLKEGGKCIIQTPFKEGNTYENPEIQSESQRREHFGQHDHVRIYSISGLEKRLAKAGFKVNLIEMDQNSKYKLTKNPILLASK